jgi:magnesium chelatase family protein
MSRISGPLMDRIDIHIEVPAVPFEELSSAKQPGTSSEQMRSDVRQARQVQAERFAGNGSGVRYNAQMTSRQVRQHCRLNDSCQKMLRHSVEEMGLSARAHDKILRVSRTIADVAGEDDIGEVHLAEAINYRNLDRDLWV